MYYHLPSRTLYNAPQSNNHHIYMSLIILLILSEDDLFNTSVHDVTMKNVDWYKERDLSEISLGGLLILVVIRTIQYNMLKMRVSLFKSNNSLRVPGGSSRKSSVAKQFRLLLFKNIFPSFYA